MFGNLTCLKGENKDLNQFQMEGMLDVLSSYFTEEFVLLSFHSSRLVFCAYNNRYQTIFNFIATCAINKLPITQFKSTNPTNERLLPTKRPVKPSQN